MLKLIPEKIKLFLWLNTFTMRRSDREVTDSAIIEDIIGKADVIRLGMYDGTEPYIVPLNFGYEKIDEESYFYMHCANEGRKIDVLKSFPGVCFELETDHNLKEAPNACGWSMYFKSVMGYGKVEIITEKFEKIKGLAILMDHYDTKGKSKPYDFSQFIDRTTILKLSVESMSCKVKDMKIE
jgi:uncharacterized protein